MENIYGFRYHYTCKDLPQTQKGLKKLSREWKEKVIPRIFITTFLINRRRSNKYHQRGWGVLLQPKYYNTMRCKWGKDVTRKQSNYKRNWEGYTRGTQNKLDPFETFELSSMLAVSNHFYPSDLGFMLKGMPTMQVKNTIL